jgi:hypothetical protein
VHHGAQREAQAGLQRSASYRSDAGLTPASGLAQAGHARQSPHRHMPRALD